MSRRIEVKLRADTSKLHRALVLAQWRTRYPHRRYYPRIAAEFDIQLEKLNRIFRPDREEPR